MKNIFENLVIETDLMESELGINLCILNTNWK